MRVPHAAIGLDYDGNDGLGMAKSAAEWKKVERRIRKELPGYVQKMVEREYDQVNVDIARGLCDIVRNGLRELLGSASQSPVESPAGSPRPTSNPATEHHRQVLNEQPPVAVSDELENVPLLDLSALLGGADQPLPGFENIEFDAPFEFGDILGCNTLDDGVDSGYASGSTAGGTLA